jgi:hypothetical protein
VSLQGTLDTLSLPDLCELLSGTNKTGALHVRSESGQGVLWFTAGQVCAGEAGGQTGPPPPGAGSDLLDRLHDVCFELFRYTEGSFEFEADRRPSWPAERGVDVSGLLVETERRMAEWREITAVIPSIEARPRRVTEPQTAGPITLDTGPWRVVTGIDGRRRVSALIRVLDGGEFTVCKILRSLVQAGLVEIDAADAAAAAPTGETASNSAAVLTATEGEVEAPPSPKAGRDRTHPEPDVEPELAVDDADPLADGLDRGAVVALLTNTRSK